MMPLGILGSAHVDSGAWSPADLPDLQLWFDASDTDTITSAATLVSQWNDKSGNARHMVQASDSLKPYTGTKTQNGLNTIEHVNSARRLSTSYSIPASAWTWLIVWARDADADGFVVLPTENTSRYFGAAQSGSGSTSIGDGASGGTMYVNGASIGGTRGAVFTACDNKASIWRCVVTFAGADVLSSNYQGGGFQSDGGLCEIIACSGTMAAGDVTAAESYLATKWGITL